LDGAAPWVGSHEEFLALTVAAYDAPYDRTRSLGEAVARFAALAHERKADADDVTALLAPGHTEGRPAPRPEAALDLATRAGILA
ncbi:hypothetical protein ACFVFI_37305, partial [Streptomyces sp. NPDC057705]|uniref:hypothetical protein n=1 Tax=Streptomyces sp. NPDC057705 TaxID=3346222 RepID=UPI0036CA1F38